MSTSEPSMAPARRWPVAGSLASANVSVLSIPLALVFGTAAFAKIPRFHELKATLAISQLVPANWLPHAAMMVIVAEIALAVSLCIPRLRRIALHSASLLVCLFVGFSGWRWLERIPVPCHCFGVFLTLTPWQAILLNLGLLAVIAFLLVSLDQNQRDVSRTAASDRRTAP